jgi:putative transcriptional regulator
MITPSTGILLIAEPFLKDPSFARSVVLICRHSDGDGTVGFSISKELETTLADLFIDLADHPLPIFLGGPVQNDTLHYIHQYPEHFDDAVEIMDGVYWGGDFEKFKTLLKTGVIESNKVKFFLGYSGWDAGQLDEELTEKSWILTEANKQIVFDTLANEVWNSSLVKLGGKYKLMVHFPTDPQLN